MTFVDRSRKYFEGLQPWELRGFIYYASAISGCFLGTLRLISYVYIEKFLTHFGMATVKFTIFILYVPPFNIIPAVSKILLVLMVISNIMKLISIIRYPRK